MDASGQSHLQAACQCVRLAGLILANVPDGFQEVAGKADRGEHLGQRRSAARWQVEASSTLRQPAHVLRHCKSQRQQIDKVIRVHMRNKDVVDLDGWRQPNQAAGHPVPAVKQDAELRRPPRGSPSCCRPRRRTLPQNPELSAASRLRSPPRLPTRMSNARSPNVPTIVCTTFALLQPTPSQNAQPVTRSPTQQGLCADCQWARLVQTRRGSSFLRCALAAEDPKFPRYPTLPVRRCSGYVRSVDGSSDGPDL